MPTRKKLPVPNALAAIPHAQAWRTALDKYQERQVDILGSIREEAINHFLEKHFQHDKDRYTFVMERTFNMGGQDRKFKLTIKATNPLVVDLPPFTVINEQPDLRRLFREGRWTELDVPQPSTWLSVPALGPGGAADPPSVRVFTKALSFELTWPKLTGGGNWTHTLPPLNVVAQAVVELHETQDGFILRLQPVLVKFDPVRRIDLRLEGKKILKSLPAKEQAALGECEEKFNDLLVIAMNVAGTTFAPKLVHDIHIPVPVMAGSRVYPTFLEIADNLVVVGATVDRKAVAAQNSMRLQSALAAFELALEQDIEEAGGFQRLMFQEQSLEHGSTPDQWVLRPQREIRAQLHRSTELVRVMQRQARHTTRSAASKLAAAVPGGIGVGVNQDVLTRLAKSAMPEPVDSCTPWRPVLEIVRGRICWWLHIFDPAVTIAGTTVSGRVSVDVGGAIEACIRRFWDCSWRWQCGRISLAIQGRPGVTLEFKDGNGIAFTARVTGRLALVSNLPWPFNKVIEALSGFVADLVMALINAVAGNIKFDILLPEFTLPEQKTKLKFSDLSPFSFMRVGGTFTPAERTFIGYDVGVTART